MLHWQANDRPQEAHTIHQLPPLPRELRKDLGGTGAKSDARQAPAHDAAGGPDLQALHLQAMLDGKSRQVVSLGDAEGLLWEAPKQRTVQRRYAAGSEIRVLLSHGGLPLAWWQRYVTAPTRSKGYRLPYEIAHQSVHAIEGERGQARRVSLSQHGFWAETFIDELAQAAGQEPYAYRLALLPEGSRQRRALEAAAQRAGWHEALPSPRHGRGIALVETDGAIAATVIEVSAGGQGLLRVHRVVTVIDDGCGDHPASAALQAEVAVLMGLDAALEVPIAPAQRPTVELHFLRSEVPSCEHPEAALPPVAPALANALFAATGERLRALPINARPTVRGDGHVPAPQL